MNTLTLITDPPDSSGTYYLVFWNESGQAWNGSAFTTYTTTREDFSVSMAQIGATGVFTLTIPTFPEGNVSWVYYKQQDGSPEHTNDSAVKFGQGYYDGSKILDDSSSGGSASGPGADAVTLTITDDVGIPITQAKVWITTTTHPDSVYAGYLLTNSQGEATFMLNAGDDYYLWMQKSGYRSIDGEPFTAVADP